MRAEDPSKKLRTLPLRVAPEEGEALTSWLEAIARRHSISFVDVAIACGVPRNLSVTAWLRIADNQLDNIANVTRLPVEYVRKMTLHSYADALPGIDFAERSGVFALWVRHQGARYCPRCIGDTGARWRTSWYLNWTFACLTHRCLLVDECPHCHRRQRADVPRIRQVPAANSRCRADTLVSSTCHGELADVYPLLLDAEDPVLAAQQSVDALLRGKDLRFGLYAGRPTPPRHVLTDLRILTQWIYTSRFVGDFHGRGSSRATAAIAEQRVVAARTQDAQWRRSGVTPYSVDMAAGMVHGLEILRSQSDWGVPQGIGELVTADAGAPPNHRTFAIRTGISPALSRALAPALVHARQGLSAQRRFDRMSARAAEVVQNSAGDQR